MSQLLGVALGLVLLGLALLGVAYRGRLKRGLSSGETIALDNVTLFSEQLKLVGRPDRIVRQNGTLIPEEWKSSKRVSDGHRLQLGAYFLLIEEEFGVRPPFGVVVLGDGSAVEVKNTDELRSKVLAVAEKIREHRRKIRDSSPITTGESADLTEFGLER